MSQWQSEYWRIKNNLSGELHRSQYAESMVLVRQKVKYLCDCLRTALLYSTKGIRVLIFPLATSIVALGCSTVTNWMLTGRPKTRIYRQAAIARFMTSLVRLF